MDNEERRLLTVVFADLSGYTTLTQRLDPEEVRDVVNICFSHLNSVITSYGGIIHKYEGDLIVALFGLPSVHEDDPERAVAACLKMFSAIPKINEVLAGKLAVPYCFNLHCGISSGTVFVGHIGSAEKYEYTVMGEVVNLASRLKDTANSGEILVSESVYRLTKYRFDYEELSPIALKGIENRVKIFKVRGEKEHPEPKRGIMGLSSPMVGRDAEFKVFEQALKKLNDGMGGVIFVSGDPGVGKSRLFAEVKNYITNKRLPINIFEGRCFSYGEHLTYHPFLQILKSILNIGDNDPPRIIEDKILSKIANLFPDNYQDIVPYIGYLFSIRFRDELDEKIRFLRPEDLKLQICLSVRKILSALVQKQPAIFLFEDFHWIDSESLKLFEFIVTTAESLSFLFVCLSRIDKDTESYRIKEQVQKKMGSNFLEINLSPLNLEESFELARNLLKESAVPREFQERILSKVAGNPFFLEEVFRSLINADILIYKDGVWHLSFDISSITIPDTVQLLIGSRLDRLEAEARSLLQQASVIGRIFSVEILERLTSLDSLMLSLQLAILEENGFIICDLKGNNILQFQFRHPLLHEYVYNSLLKKIRRELHRKVGMIIEDLYQDHLEEYFDILAYQYSNSDDAQKAVEWLLKAGRRAKAQYASEQAIKMFEEAIRIISKELNKKSDDLCLIYEDLGDIRNLLGEYKSAIKNFESMFSCANSCSVKARARRKIAEVYTNQNRLTDALQVLAEAVSLLDNQLMEDKMERAEIHMVFGSIYRCQGKMEQARAECETGLEILKSFEILSPAVIRTREKGLRTLGVICNIQGDYTKANEYFTGCLRLAQEVGDKRLMADSYGNLSMVNYYLRRYDQAIEQGKMFLSIAEKIGDKKSLGRASNNLGLIYRAQGRYDEALRLFQNYLLISKDIGDQQGMAIACGNMGPIHYAQGDYEGAEELFKTHLKISETLGEKRSIGVASFNLGFLYFMRNDYQQALEYFLKDLAISEELGDRRGVAITSLSVGRLLVKIGSFEEALKRLQKAEKLLKELDTRQELIENYLGYAELSIARQEPLDKIVAYIDKAFEIAQDVNSLKEKAECYFTYGCAYARAGDLKRAEENLLYALELYTKTNFRRELADVYYQLADILDKRGEKAKAQKYREQALEIYHRLKIKYQS